MNLSIKHLKVFVAIAEEGSFTRASDVLHQTQPTLTGLIAQLERQLELKLFDRTTRRVELTASGQEFLPVARRLIRDFEAALTDMRDLAGLKKGIVRIGGAPSAVAMILAPAIAHFSQIYPGVRVALTDTTSRTIEEKVLSGEFDFGLSSIWSDVSQLNWIPVLKDQFGIVVSESHCLAAATQATWDDLETERVIGLANDTGIRAILKSFLNLPRSIQMPFYETSSTTSLDALVKSGAGVAVLPALAAQRLSTNGLVFLPINGPSAERTLGILSAKQRLVTPAAAELQKCVFDYIDNMEIPPGCERVHRDNAS